MDQGTLLVLVTCALVVVLMAWAVRELVPLVRRRRASRRGEADEERPGAAAELVPLLLQPVAALVKNIGRNRTSMGTATPFVLWRIWTVASSDIGSTVTDNASAYARPKSVSPSEMRRVGRSSGRN